MKASPEKEGIPVFGGGRRGSVIGGHGGRGELGGVAPGAKINPWSLSGA